MNGGSDSMCRLGQFPTAGDRRRCYAPYGRLRPWERRQVQRIQRWERRKGC